MASFLVLLLAAEVASVVVLQQVGSRRIDEQADRQLAAATEDFRARVAPVADRVGSPGGPTLSSVFDDYLASRPTRADEAYLTFVAGRPYAASAGSPVALQALPAAARWAATTRSASGSLDTTAGPVRWVAVPVTGGGQVLGVLVAAEFLAGQQRALRGTVATVSLVTLLVLVAACLLAWGAAGRALAPLRHLADRSRSIVGGDDLGARLAVDGHDEVADLAGSLNAMLERLEGAFDSQKRFLDDAGHQLRAPLTVARGHLELLGDDPEEREADVALVLDELDRMDRMVRDLRTLARSGRPDFVVPAAVDTSDLLAEVGRKATALADRDWVVVDREAGEVTADRQRLTEALLNLAENAAEATGAGGRIELGAEPAEGGVRLWVRDDGRGLDPADLDTLFDRDRRTVPARPGGTGLGLPIVAAIARAHGGTVSADGAPGQGACVTLELPRSRT